MAAVVVPPRLLSSALKASARGSSRRRRRRLVLERGPLSRVGTLHHPLLLLSLRLWRLVLPVPVRALRLRRRSLCPRRILGTLVEWPVW